MFRHRTSPTGVAANMTALNLVAMMHRHNRRFLHGHRTQRRLLATAAVFVLAVGMAVLHDNADHSAGHGFDHRNNPVLVVAAKPVQLFDNLEPPHQDFGWLAQLIPQTQRHLCAVEMGTCTCVGTAMLHTWTGDSAMVRHVNSSIECSTKAFGDDPRPHFAKFCSCLPGLAWPRDMIDGLRATLARKLIPRVEIGAPGAGCGSEDDGAWTPCSIMSTRLDASLFPERLLQRLQPVEQEDATLRKLDACHHIAGEEQALRVLGIWPASARVASVPLKATDAAVCAVVYSPDRGPIWDSRRVIFCPTQPPQCLEEGCECADETYNRIDVHASENGTVAACWACVPPQEADQPLAPVNRKVQPAPAARSTQAEPGTMARQSSSLTGISRSQMTPAVAAGEPR